MKNKISDVMLATGLIGIFLCVQTFMILDDSYEAIRAKVKGPRGTS